MIDIKDYKAYRKEGRRLNQEIVESCIDKDLMEKSAKMLGIIGKKGIILFENEEEANVLMDFAIYEILLDGESVIKIYSDTVGGKNKMETEILDAMVASYTSLFRVISTRKEQSLVILEDILHEGRIIELTDMGLSQSLHQEVLIFTRIVPFAEFNMTAGIAFVFPKEILFHSLEALKNSASERYIEFFRLNRECGMKTAFV